MNFFLVKSKTSGLGTTVLKCKIVRFSELLDVLLKGFAVYYIIVGS